MSTTNEMECRQVSEESVTDFKPVSSKSSFPELTSRRARQVYGSGNRTAQALAALKTTIINGHCLIAKGYRVEEDAHVQGRYHVHSPSNRSHVVDVFVMADGTVSANCDETCEMFTMHGFCLHCEHCIVLNESAMRDFLAARQAMESAYAPLMHLFGEMTVRYSIPTVTVPDKEDEYQPARDANYATANRPNATGRKPERKGYVALSRDTRYRTDAIRKYTQPPVAQEESDYIPRRVTPERYAADWAQ